MLVLTVPSYPDAIESGTSSRKPRPTKISPKTNLPGLEGSSLRAAIHTQRPANTGASIMMNRALSDWNQVDFSKDMDRRFPVVISDIITTNGADPCTLRYQNLLPDSIDLFLQEETSVTTETSHGTEEVSIFVAE